MARIWPGLVLLVVLAGCQSPGDGTGQRDITGRNLGAAAWEELPVEDAKTRFPGLPRKNVLAAWSRTLPVGQYQEAFAVQVGLTYVFIQMAESREGGFEKTLAPNQYRALFRESQDGGGPVPYADLEPELVNGVQQATYMLGSKPCFTFYRAAGYIIGAAFGIDGSAYLAATACGPMKADPAAFQAEMNRFAAGIRVGRR